MGLIEFNSKETGETRLPLGPKKTKKLPRNAQKSSVPHPHLILFIFTKKKKPYSIHQDHLIFDDTWSICVHTIPVSILFSLDDLVYYFPKMLRFPRKTYIVDHIYHPLLDPLVPCNNSPILSFINIHIPQTTLQIQN